MFAFVFHLNLPESDLVLDKNQILKLNLLLSVLLYNM